MKHLFNHLILIGFNILTLIFFLLLNAHSKGVSVPSFLSNEHIVFFIGSICFSSLCYFFSSKKFTILFSVIYGILSCIFPEGLLFASLIIYAMSYSRFYYPAAFLLLGLFLHFFSEMPVLFFLILFGYLLAFYLCLQDEEYEKLLFESRKMRDDSIEKNLLLEQRNQMLLEKQNYEINNATLQERNRIAREIHDNVGHLLSRCILLTGAVKTINQTEACNDPLTSLEDALKQAMDNIRNSVHDLHDESINLEESIQGLLQDFTFCPIDYSYDMGYEIPKDIKYTFITITKEGLTNISRHSNATKARLTLREHPGFYQMILSDNGSTFHKNITAEELTGNDRPDGSGIGLNNIASRVKHMNGRLQINTESGFSLFIILPKNNPQR